jgi:Flp pilus assembly protein TadB
MIVREFGSTLERKYFKNRLGFPTNYLMLYQNDKLPNQSKDKYGDKIKNDFELRRLNEYEEGNNIGEALKILSQASRLISTKYQQQEQVKDASIAYGFSRNVSGGLLLSIPSSIAGIITGLLLKEYSLLLWSSVVAVIFITLFIFHKQWIIRNAEKYAEKLISVYLSDN